MKTTTSKTMVLIKVILLNVFNILLFTSSAASSQDNELTVEEIVELINALNTTWTAGHNPEVTEEYIRVRARAIVDIDGGTSLQRIAHDPDFIANLPESFDARKQWPDCPSLSQIRDQGRCGSCWAFAVTAVITDRYCIKSNGTKQFNFSAQDLTSCDFKNAGCEGGNIERAFDYWVKTGIVSGGEYQSNEGCYPYEIPHDKGPLLPTPKCKTTCREGYNTEYLKDKQRGLESYTITTEEDMMAEIYKNGPIVSTFEVFEDFRHYISGIYQHVYGEHQGFHAVKTLGWGVEDGKKYWLVANSWGAEWALESGYFKIIRGNNECLFEDECVTGEPIV